MTVASRLRAAAACLPAAAFCLLAAGCMDGYPTEDVMALDAMGPAEHVQALNRRLGEGGGPPMRVAMGADCRLQWQGASEPASLALPAISVRFDTDPDTGRYLVLVAEQAGQPPRTAFEVRDWVAAVAFRSHLQQLQHLCMAQADA
ncbi:hypothetical protein ABIC63_003072 [Pseudacidovorax sp. 1753]|uniref:hypothetical protein n=1 Tax=Pseudacidovorax TaxID=433923 RepID=UPI0012DEFA20|nr:hypothetical protein [Pseudacidovorax intermedius]